MTFTDDNNFVKTIILTIGFVVMIYLILKRFHVARTMQNSKKVMIGIFGGWFFFICIIVLGILMSLGLEGNFITLVFLIFGLLASLFFGFGTQAENEEIQKNNIKKSHSHVSFIVFYLCGLYFLLMILLWYLKYYV